LSEIIPLIKEKNIILKTSLAHSSLSLEIQILFFNKNITNLLKRPQLILIPPNFLADPLSKYYPYLRNLNNLS